MSRYSPHRLRQRREQRYIRACHAQIIQTFRCHGTSPRGVWIALTQPSTDDERGLARFGGLLLAWTRLDDRLRVPPPMRKFRRAKKRGGSFYVVPA